MRVRISTKSLIARCFLGSSLFFITACRSSNIEESTSSAKAIKFDSTAITQLNVMGQWLYQGNREKLIKEFVREYGFLHQNLDITLKFPEEVYMKSNGSSANLEWVAQTIKSEKPEWDIVMINNESGTCTYTQNEPDWPKKYLVDFSQYPEFRNNTLPELLTDSIKNIWHGIIPGPFIEGYNYALWCNLNVARKVGIEVKQFDMTYDNLLSYVKAVYEYNLKNKDNQIAPFFEAGDWRTLDNIAHVLFMSALSDDKEYLSDRVSDRKLDAWHTTLQCIEELSKYKPLCDQWDTMSWSNNRNRILDDQFLFFSNGSWMYNWWQAYDPQKVKNMMPAEYPHFKKTNYYIGGYQITWAVPKNAPHKEEAVKFLLALNTIDVADKWVQYTKCSTGILGRMNDVEFGYDNVETFTYTVQKKYGKSKVPADLKSKLFGSAHSSGNFYFHEVLQGKMTADEAIKLVKSNLRK